MGKNKSFQDYEDEPISNSINEADNILSRMYSGEKEKQQILEEASKPIQIDVPWSATDSSIKEPRIRILSNVKFGSSRNPAKLDYIKKFIEDVKANPEHMVILGGNLFDYETQYSKVDLIKTFADLLEPIADQIIFAYNGDQELRIERAITTITYTDSEYAEQMDLFGNYERINTKEENEMEVHLQANYYLMKELGIEDKFIDSTKALVQFNYHDAKTNKPVYTGRIAFESSKTMAAAASSQGQKAATSPHWRLADYVFFTTANVNAHFRKGIYGKADAAKAFKQVKQREIGIVLHSGEKQYQDLTGKSLGRQNTRPEYAYEMALLKPVIGPSLINIQRDDYKLVVNRIPVVEKFGTKEAYDISKELALTMRKNESTYDQLQEAILEKAKKANAEAIRDANRKFKKVYQEHLAK